MSYRPLYEDPTYDEDGQCPDDDHVEDTIDPAEWDIAFPSQRDYDPWATINS
jgi:hypothetical protein